MNDTGQTGRESDKSTFTVTDTTHRTLGALRVLKLGDALTVRLTPVEAHTLALALFAVKDGRSAETELFMSPIASDAIFVAQVSPAGIAVETPAGPIALGWDDVTALAGRLSPAAVPAT
jgi:hypothetical protein